MKEPATPGQGVEAQMGSNLSSLSQDSKSGVYPACLLGGGSGLASRQACPAQGLPRWAAGASVRHNY